MYRDDTQPVAVEEKEKDKYWEKVLLSGWHYIGFYYNASSDYGIPAFFIVDSCIYTINIAMGLSNIEGLKVYLKEMINVWWR